MLISSLVFIITFKFIFVVSKIWDINQKQWKNCQIVGFVRLFPSGSRQFCLMILRMMMMMMMIIIIIVIIIIIIIIIIFFYF